MTEESDFTKYRPKVTEVTVVEAATLIGLHRRARVKWPKIGNTLSIFSPARIIHSAYKATKPGHKLWF